MTAMADWTGLVVSEARRRRLDAESVPLSRARQRHLALPQQGVDLMRPAGHRIEAHDVGAFAAAGLATVPVARRPVVAVFSDPTARVPAGQALLAGQRWDAERPLLMARLQEEGLDPLGWPLVATGPDAVVAAIREAAEGVDAILLCGLDLAGARPAWIDAFERTDLRWWWPPGDAPVLGLEFGRSSAKAAVFALPSGLVDVDDGFSRVVRPYLRALQGGP